VYFTGRFPSQTALAGVLHEQKWRERALSTCIKQPSLKAGTWLHFLKARQSFDFLESFVLFQAPGSHEIWLPYFMAAPSVGVVAGGRKA